MEFCISTAGDIDKLIELHRDNPTALSRVFKAVVDKHLLSYVTYMVRRYFDIIVSVHADMMTELYTLSKPAYLKDYFAMFTFACIDTPVRLGEVEYNHLVKNYGNLTLTYLAFHNQLHRLKYFLKTRMSSIENVDLMHVHEIATNAGYIEMAQYLECVLKDMDGKYSIS